MFTALIEFLGDILLDIFFNTVCAWTGEIILFAVTLSRRQPNFRDASGWSSWLGLAFWVAVIAGIVFGLIRLGVLKF